MYTLFASGNIDVSFALSVTSIFFQNIIRVFSLVFIVGISIEICYGSIFKTNNLSKRETIKLYIRNKQENLRKSKLFSLAIALIWIMFTYIF